jgi:hypothetical protein
LKRQNGGEVPTPSDSSEGQPVQRYPFPVDIKGPPSKTLANIFDPVYNAKEANESPLRPNRSEGVRSRRLWRPRSMKPCFTIMELVGKLCETFDLRKSGKVADTYLDIAVLDRDLNSWYNSLADDLKWREENIQDAPTSFFLLQ